ncbi:glycine-rich protein [Aurantibacillus circumpalustris]|uniref:glycine-rich protein n=1 Tax=Aurantibacillus circumpalustris TaxID=3036359 RepID=UPI00295C1DF8|nr:glycine-rich protein [Aurantibacillus circumpalustris]
MKRKIYKLVSGAKTELLALALALFSITAYSQTTYTFSYTGGQQTIALQAGSYSVQCWGAKGESAVNQPTGGIGGYSAGTFSLSSTTTVYVSAGGKGSLGPSSGAFANGGWNGGGQGYGSTVIGAGGGGASHIATVTGVLSALSSNTSAIIIVAGGGGGSGYAGVGGNGGGVTGGNGNSGTGGTTGGTFGVGAIGTTAGTCGGGGGGWFGGNLGSPGNTGGAGGGSGYIGGLISGITVQSGQTGFVSDPDVTGNGLVLITELCNISIYSSGTNSLNPSICSGQSLTLTTNATSNYSWSTGQTTNSIVVAPNTNTVYSLVATSSLNCSTSTTRSVTVSSLPPVISISNPSNNICLGKTVSLTASGALTYTWVNAGVVNGQTFTPSATAAYTVMGQNGCGTTNATTTITVAPLVVTATAPVTLVCAGSTATLTATSAVPNYTWLPGPFTGSTVVASPTANTLYTVIASDGACNGTATLNITTKVTPTITSSASSATICQGLSTTLNASGAGTGGTYSWTPGGAGSQITVSPATSTLYTLMGTNTLNCTGLTQQLVIVDNMPIFNVVANKTLVCSGQTVNLVASGNSISGFVWTNGPSTGTYTPTVSTTNVYTVTASHSANTCTATKTIVVAAIIPNVTFPVDTSICAGGTATITASGATSYVFNGLTNGTSGTTIFQPQQTTTITIIATTTSLTTNCPLTQTLLLSVNPLPTLTVVATRTAICKSETNTLTPSGAQSFTLTSATGATNTGTSFVITPTASVLYTVTGTDSKGCKAELVLQAKVNTCNSLNEFNFNTTAWLVYPNPSNGTFILKSDVPLDLTLVNELGQQVRTIQLEAANGFSVEIKNLRAGIYFVIDKNSSGTARKIVVE